MSYIRFTLLWLLASALPVSLVVSTVKASDTIVCPYPGGIIDGDNPIRNRELKELQKRGKDSVGGVTTTPSGATIYLTTVSDGSLFATSNFRPICPANAREEFEKEGVLENGRFIIPLKLLSKKKDWSLTEITRVFLLNDFSIAGMRDDVAFIVDEKLLGDRIYRGIDLSVANRVSIADKSGDVWARDAYDLISRNSTLKRWVKRVGATDVDRIKRVSELIGDREFASVADRFNPSSVFELSSLKTMLKDADLVGVANRLGISNVRDLDGLKATLTRHRGPDVRKASITDKALTLKDENGGSPIKVSDLLTQLRSGKTLPEEWTGNGDKFIMLDVADLSAADTGKLAGRVLEMVAEASPDGDGPGLVFTKNPTRARQRLTSLIDYGEVEFLNDEASLLKVDRFGPLAKVILDGLIAGEPDGPHFRFVVGHLDDDASVLSRLIADAKAGRFRDSHLGVGVCNSPKNWAKFLDLYDAAMENGALSVTFPTRTINVPAMTLMAVTLKGNPSLLRLSAPQAAVRKAYREAHKLLAEAADTAKSDADRRSAIRLAFGENALEFFLIDGKLHQATIDEVLRALETDGTRLVPLAKGNRASHSDGIVKIRHDEQMSLDKGFESD